MDVDEVELRAVEQLLQGARDVERQRDRAAAPERQRLPTASTDALPGSSKSASGSDASFWTFARPSRTSSRESDGATTTTRWPRAQSASESRSTKRLTSWCCSHGHGVTCAIENGSRGTRAGYAAPDEGLGARDRLYRKTYTLCSMQTRDRRSRHRRAHLCPPAAPPPRHHGVRGRGAAGRTHAHRPRRARRRSGPRGHRLHRLQRPQLPGLRAPARATRRRHPAVGHELLGQRRRGRLRIQRRLGKRPVRAPLEPAEPVLSPDGARPAALQSRGAGPDRPERLRPDVARLPGRGRLLDPVRRALDRSAGRRCLVGRPPAAAELPRQPARGVLRPARHVRLQRPAAAGVRSAAARRATSSA